MTVGVKDCVHAGNNKDTAIRARPNTSNVHPRSSIASSPFCKGRNRVGEEYTPANAPSTGVVPSIRYGTYPGLTRREPQFSPCSGAFATGARNLARTYGGPFEPSQSQQRTPPGRCECSKPLYLSHALALSSARLNTIEAGLECSRPGFVHRASHAACAGNIDACWAQPTVCNPSVTLQAVHVRAGGGMHASLSL